MRSRPSACRTSTPRSSSPPPELGHHPELGHDRPRAQGGLGAEVVANRRVGDLDRRWDSSRDSRARRPGSTTIEDTPRSLRAGRGPVTHAGAYVSSTRSANMTSPSSVRCTGHFAATWSSRSRCSCGTPPGKRTDHVEARGRAAMGRLEVHLDLDLAHVPALAPGVHLHRDRRAGSEARRQQLLGLGPGVLAAEVPGLVRGHHVRADLHALAEAGVLALRDGPHESRPPNSSGSGSSA